MQLTWGTTWQLGLLESSSWRRRSLKLFILFNVKQSDEDYEPFCLSFMSFMVRYSLLAFLSFCLPEMTPSGWQQTSRSESSCCSEPISYAAVEEDCTGGLVLEVFDGLDKVYKTQKDSNGHQSMKRTGWERSQAAHKVLFQWAVTWRTGWFPTKPNLAKLDGRCQIMRIGVCHLLRKSQKSWVPQTNCGRRNLRQKFGWFMTYLFNPPPPFFSHQP